MALRDFKNIFYNEETEDIANSAHSHDLYSYIQSL